MKTVKPGNWYDASVWDSGRVPAETDDIILEHDLYTDKKSVVIKNRLYARKGSLEFRGVVETEFIGSISDPKDPNYGVADEFGVVYGDIGLWSVGAGVLDLVGQSKNRWTNATGSVPVGAKSITVLDATGWNVNDWLCIVPTRKPTVYPDWNDSTNSPIDPFTQEFERRKITGITGNTLSFAEALQYDHAQVVTDDGKKWTAEVGNLTSNVAVRGTKSGRAHIFMKSSKPQNIVNVEFSYLGPRQGGARPQLWEGRYGLHFHHAGDGSRGSKIESNAIHDLGSRGIVPHGSNGINVENNFVLAYMNDGLWWDPGHRTHDHVYKRNLVACVIYNGGSAGNTSGIQYGQGDGNRSESNVCVYTKMGDDPHIGGGHVWNANDEGVWIMLNNLSHSMQTGFFVWQNTPNDHTVDGLEAYNCIIAGMQGAYGNSYSFYKCYFFNSPLNLKATPGNDAPMFTDCIFDGGGKVTHVVEMQGSAIPAGYGNRFVNCSFKNYSDVAFLINTYDGHGSIGRKGVDLVLCKFTGRVYRFSAQSIFESWLREQPLNNGQSYRADQKGVVNISPFAPTYWGTGNGLTGDYYNGSNFESKAFTRIDQNIKFQQWTVDPGASPDGVHHLIKGDAYSMRWTGFVEPQYNDTFQFVVDSFGGVRVFIELNGQEVKVLDRWAENNDRVSIVSSSVVLLAANKYRVRVEHMNQGGDRGFVLSWQSPKLGAVCLIPRSQLYTATTPAPVTYYSKEFTGQFTRNNCPADNTPGQITFTVPAGKHTSTTSQAAADAKAEADFKVNGQAAANTNGTCTPPKVYKNAEKSQTFTRNNCAAGETGTQVVYTVPAGTYSSTVSQAEADKQAADDVARNGQNYANATGTCTMPAVELKADAGVDFSATGTQVTLDGTKSAGKWQMVNWYMDAGPSSWNIVDQNNIVTVANRLILGVYTFRLKLTAADGKTSTDYVVVTIGTEPPKPRTITGTVIELPDGKTEADNRAMKSVTVKFSDNTEQVVK